MAAERTLAPGLDAGTEEPVRRFIQLVLRGGLAIAFVLMAVGTVVKVVEGGAAAPAVRLFHLGRGVPAGDTIMGAGILALAITPAIRVFALIVLWAREHDWKYVGVATIVLVVLLVAVAVGHG